MLTREQAQISDCPLMSRFKAHVYCKENRCPKWADTDKHPLCTLEQEYHVKGMPYPKEGRKLQCRAEKGVETCNDCPERFGYCR